MSKNTNRGVSIIMPCYNAGYFVVAAVQSVADHIGDTVPFEIILVDDGSSTKTRHIIEGVAYEDRPYLKTFILEKNVGQSAARNLALQQAQYDYILPVDADDMLTTDLDVLAKGSYPQRAIKALEEDQDLAFVLTNIKKIGAETGDYVLPALNLQTILLYGQIPVCSVFRKSDVANSGGYPKDMHCVEDWGFHVALMQSRLMQGKGLGMKRFPESYYSYRQHSHGKNVNSRERAVADVRMELYQSYPFIYRHAFKRKAKLGCQIESFLDSQVYKFSLLEKVRLARERPSFVLRRMFEKSADVLSPVMKEGAAILREESLSVSSLFKLMHIP